MAKCAAMQVPPEWPKECLPSSWSIQQSMPRPVRRSRPPKAQTKHRTRLAWHVQDCWAFRLYAGKFTVQASIISWVVRTYKGKNVAEAEVVRTRTPMQTDAMLQAAVLRRFVSSNLPKSHQAALLATLTEIRVLRNLEHINKSDMQLHRHTCI